MTLAPWHVGVIGLAFIAGLVRGYLKGWWDAMELPDAERRHWRAGA
jgi:hypothetical protein